MKRMLASLAAAFVVFQGAAIAGMVGGAVQSVDPTTKSIVVGETSVTYSDTTTWPEGVTDPESLVGENVTVTTDDATSEATSVEKASAGEAFPVAPVEPAPIQ